MKKKSLFILLFFIMIFLLFQIESFGLTEGNFSYRVINDNEAIITYYTGNDSDVVIPETIDNYTIVSINERVFEGNNSIASIKISKNITDIGELALYRCSNLKSIDVDENNNYYCSENGVLFNKEKTTLIQYPIAKKDANYIIPESVTCIEKCAFFECTNLINVTMPSNLTNMGTEVFARCSNLSNITIPEGIIKIDADTFSECSNLISVAIPESVISIERFAFSHCTSLTNVIIPGNVTSIEYSAFFGCSSLNSIDVESNNNYYCSKDGILFNKEETILIKYPAHKKDINYAIPENVIKIEVSAFENCTNLIEIVLPDNITEIKENTFNNCINLEKLVIPKNVISIGRGSFYNCNKLMNILIPEGITSIEDSTFYGCSSLTNIIIPKSVTCIGIAAFYGCSNLINITIPDGVTQIGANAFYECSSLTTITIPDGVTNIGCDAFNRCNNLTNISIPNSVSSIDLNMFNECNSLTSITLRPNTSISGYLSENSNNLMIYGYTDSYIEYYAKEHNYKFIAINKYTDNGLEYEIKNNKEIIIVGYKGKSKEITIPSTIENYPVTIIEGCSDNCTSIMIPDSVNKIMDKVLRIESLASINVDENNKTYSSENGVLFNKEKTVLIQYPMSKVGTDYVVPEGVTDINDYAFYYSTVQDITLPQSLTNIGDFAFMHSNISNLILPENLINIGEYAFSCTNIKEIILPNSVTDIGSAAFWACKNLKSIEIPKSVKVINNGMFQDCSSLTSIIIPKEVTDIIGVSTFSGCNNLTIYGYKNSVAEEYATKQKIKFEVIASENYIKEETKVDEIEVNGNKISLLPAESKIEIDDFIKEKFIENSKYDIEIKDINGNIKSSGKIGSKNIITIKDGEDTIAEYTVIVPGDITGNGYSRMYDSFQILKDSINGKQIDAIEIKIRDFNGDEKVRMYDAFQYLKQAILGK